MLSALLHPDPDNLARPCGAPLVLASSARTLIAAPHLGFPLAHERIRGLQACPRSQTARPHLQAESQDPPLLAHDSRYAVRRQQRVQRPPRGGYGPAAGGGPPGTPSGGGPAPAARW